MFQTGETSSFLRPCVDEALACRDVLAPAPPTPGPVARLRGWAASSRRVPRLRSVLALARRPRPHPLPLRD